MVRQILAEMAPFRERRKRAHLFEELCDDSIGGVNAVGSDELPNLIQIEQRVRMKSEAGQAVPVRRLALFAWKCRSASSPLIGWTLPLDRSSYRLLNNERVSATSAT